MSKGNYFEMNRKGIGQLLKSQDMMGVITEGANQVRGRAGEGYEVETYVGFDRVHAVVFTATDEAKRDNYENNTLLKARGGGV